MRTASILASLLFLTFTLFASSASAVLVDFGCITDNNAGNCAIGEAQLALDITDEGSNQIRFTFTNTGPDNSVISEIYFDDGALLGIASVIGGPGVSFSQGGSPPNLPGGNQASPPFEVTAGFLVDASNPAPANGVGPGETVAIVFDLIGGFDFNDAVAQFADGTVRAGVHVVAFASGGSESFVNNPVPEPGTALMMLGGLIGLSVRARQLS